MIDLQFQDTKEGGDLVVKGSDLKLTQGWDTMLFLSLFGGNVEESTDGSRTEGEIPEDYWANSLLFGGNPGLQFNSRTVRVLQEQQLSKDTIFNLEQAARADLDQLQQFATIEVSAELLSPDSAQLNITITEPGNQEGGLYQFLWDGVEKRLKGAGAEEPDTTEYEDFQFTGDPTTSAGGTKTQTYTFTFEANSSRYNAQTIEANGTIQQIVNPVNYTLSKLTSSSPFKQQIQVSDSVSEGDIITVKLDSIPASKVTVEIVVSYSDESYAKTLPADLGGNARYLYILNHTDETVSCVDLVNANEIATLPMRSGYPGNIDVSVKYRYQEKEVWIMESTGYPDYLIYSVIDADPQSSNFNTYKIKGYITGEEVNRGASICFIQNQDVFVSCHGNNFTNFNKTFAKKPGLGFFNNWGGNSANNSFLLGDYMFGGGSNGSKEVAFYTKPSYKAIKSLGGSKTGAGRYNPNNGLIYWVGRGNVAVVEVNTWTVIASLSAGTDRGSLDIDLDNNIVLAVDSSPSGAVAKIDASTNTVKGTEDQGEAMDQIYWSRASGYFYSRKRGTDQLFVFDATKSPGSMKVNQITVGNTPGTNYVNNPCACINQIML